MKYIITIISLIVNLLVFGQSPYQYSWKYYTTGNTGILGDYSEALWVDGNGMPYIAAYTPGWEEGGFSKFNPAANLWENYSNMEYPVIGSTYDVGSSRISDIVPDGQGRLWMATWRGVLLFDPSAGGSSLQFWGAANSPHPGGRTVDLDVAPDGTVWAAILSVVWGNGGLVQYDPATAQWRYWGYLSTGNNWPPLIGQCEHVTVQPKTGGGYTVWVDGEGWNTMITFDSDTQLFTLLPQEGVAGEVVSLPGDGCLDAEGNLWALRFTAAGQPFSLDYRQPGGTWITPAQPPVATGDIWAFKAYGPHRALITGLSSEIYQFNGANWESRGIWREGAYTSALDVDAANNIWVSGTEGAARRDALSGQWQRYRITNSSQIDYWVQDMAFDAEGHLWMTGNAGPGVGGFQQFDGTSWAGFNQFTYGLGNPFPFPCDNTQRIFCRPSNGEVIINPTYEGLHAWNGTGYTSLAGSASESKGITEDSQGRLWNLGPYYRLEYLQGSTWISVPFTGWGANLRPDLTRPATVWACSGWQVLRTDGSDSFSRDVSDFSELDPQSDMLSAVIPGENNIAWIGSNKGLFRLDATSGTYQFWSPGNSAIPGESITPLALTPDGRIWFSTFGSTTTIQTGLGWFDGISFGFFPMEDGGLPHSQIPDAEVKVIPGGYEIWMTCLSRGIAVLHVMTDPVNVGEPVASVDGPALSVFPNPFRDRVAMAIHLHESGHARVEIFDQLGRPVAVLADGIQPAGESMFQWDGRYASGRELQAGAFLCRFISEHITESRILIKH